MDFYREELMEHFKHPQNRGVLAKPTVSVHQKNPMCGDELTLYLDIQNGKISDVSFEGNACAVTVVSSSMFTEAIKGKTLEEAKNFSKNDLLEMYDVNLTTSRIKCATLVLDALQKALETYEPKN